jgi:hypothetical protein
MMNSAAVMGACELYECFFSGKAGRLQTAPANMVGTALVGATSRNALGRILRLVVARFPAVLAIVLPVLRQADAEVGMAERAVFEASASIFGLVTDHASKLFVGHRLTISRCVLNLSSSSSILSHPKTKINIRQGREAGTRAFIIGFGETGHDPHPC